MVLGFFGWEITATCSQADSKHLEFLYRPHVMQQPSIHADDKASVELRAEHEAGFFRSVLAKDGREKSFSVRIAGETVRRTFRGWSGSAAPLPPLVHPKFAQNFVVLNAAVVEKGGRCVAIFGPNYSGKTSVALHMCTELGWSLVSDHLLVLDARSARVWSYGSPVGLRGRAREDFEASSANETIERREVISEVTGRVLLLRPEQLCTTTDGLRGSLEGLVLLSPECRDIRTVPTADLGGPPCFPPGRSAEALTMLPAHTILVPAAGERTPGQAAHAISASFDI
ncbi:hypothetical protein [Couchioplanes caeruleus]|uniref:hypothetical protein n=1 Tax=Couchioplanes caeruleus TaxID=56438 RepID=UPI001160D07A|nr:hypothetical protein [Couchioplanes caeruleus]